MDKLFALIFFVSIGFIIYYSVKRFQTKSKDPDTYNRIKNRVWYATLVALLSISAIGGIASLFLMIMLLSLVAIIYYVVRMLQTRKKNPTTYNKIKYRIWYSLLIFIISFSIFGISSKPASTKTSNAVPTVVKKVGVTDKKKAESKYESIQKAVSSKESESESLTSKLEKKESEATAESKAKESSAKAKAESESAQKVADEKSSSESTQESNSKKAASESRTSSDSQQTTQSRDSSPSTSTDKVTTGEGTIIGNTNSKIYHVPGQSGYKINSGNAITFQSEQQAIDAGYRKAKR
ncbi:hypothetical protein [Dellaglioa algida]|uniref:sunset domain-containing protein n=1 Tax=Dellaglioa algida TaxID=105612 RepID=UPI0024C49ECC|nr:hypothetical protein [Dellaglioa algida]MDK1716594.1 hypothetical protein [Dellaglioa algida]MDK1721536.1 hypothetical protein [Dellaglioa algida]